MHRRPGPPVPEVPGYTDEARADAPPDDDHAVWTVEVPRAGHYGVWLDWACARNSAGKQYVLQADANQLTGRVASTGDWDAYRQEHVGDIIDKNLSEVAAKKIKRKLQFSSEGAAELTAFHKRVLDSLKTAFAVFISADVNDARALISEKARLRDAEIAAAERHFERLREGRPETLETTSLHLDVLRDLKRIHSHICSVAYPVLEAAGQMSAADVAESDPITVAAPNAKSAIR